MGRRPAGLFSPARVCGDGGAALFARIPGFEDRRRVLLRPVDGQSAAVHKHDHQRLAGRGQRFEQLTLHGGQGDVGAVASAEALDVYRHLFALEIGREADEGNDDIGLFGHGDGFVAESVGIGLPLEANSATAAWAVVRIFDTNFMRLAGVEVDRERASPALAAFFADIERRLAVYKSAVDVAA